MVLIFLLKTDVSTAKRVVMSEFVSLDVEVTPTRIGMLFSTTSILVDIFLKKLLIMLPTPSYRNIDYVSL